MTTADPKKRQVITSGSDDAIKACIFRVLDWEPQQFKRYSFRRGCGWRDGGVSTVDLKPDDYTAKSFGVHQHVMVSIWFEQKGWQQRTYVEDIPIEEWYRRMSNGKIKRLFK